MRNALFVTKELYADWDRALMLGDYSDFSEEREIEIEGWLQNQSANYEMFACTGRSTFPHHGVPDSGGKAGQIATYRFRVK